MKKAVFHSLALIIGILIGYSSIFFKPYKTYTIIDNDGKDSFCSTPIEKRSKTKNLNEILTVPANFTADNWNSILNKLYRLEERLPNEKVIELLKAPNDVTNLSLSVLKKIIPDENIIYIERVDSTYNKSFIKISTVF